MSLMNNITYHFSDGFYRLAALCEGVPSGDGVASNGATYSAPQPPVQQQADGHSLQMNTVDVKAVQQPRTALPPHTITPADKTAVKNPYKEMKFLSQKKIYDLDSDEDVDALLRDIEVSPEMKKAFFQRMKEISEWSRKGDKFATEVLMDVKAAMNKTDPEGLRLEAEEV
jgi:hypothetical protein